jgi:hypothetical protein
MIFHLTDMAFMAAMCFGLVVSMKLADVAGVIFQGRVGVVTMSSLLMMVQ